MRRALSAGLLSAVALFATSSLSSFGSQSRPPAPQTTDAGTAAISGVVTDAVTGRRIAGASVTLYGVIPGTQEPQITLSSMLTDPRGRFVFANLSATHRYALIATSAGYGAWSYTSPETVTTSALVRVDEDLVIQLADGEWKRDANIRMWRLGSIGGRVLDERGEAVIGAAVRIYSRRLLAGRERLVPGAVVTTDDRGVYRVSSIVPGRYFVAVLSVQATVPASTADGPRGLPLGGLHGRGSTPPVSRTEASGASIDVDGRHRLVLTNFVTPPPPGGDGARAYAPVFYPTALALDGALAVELDAGTNRSDVDFQLVPVATVRVSGRVTGPVEDASNMLLRLMAPGTEHLGFGSEVATSLVEADGTFTFLNVPAGDYTLLASPSVAEISGGGGASEGRLPRGVGYGRALGLSEVYRGAGFSAMWWRSEAGATVWGRITVSLGDADVTGIELPLRTAATVRGRVVFDDPEQPEPRQRFSVRLEPASGDPSLGVPNAWTAAGDTSYAFEIGGLQGGRYLVRFQTFGDWRVKSVTVNGNDVTDTGFDGAPGLDYDNVVITVAKGGAELSGVVRDRSGGPAPGAVLLFPADPKLWVDYGLTPDRLHSTRAAPDGTYTFTSLRDGDYLVVAVPPAQAGEWLDPKFLAAAAALATRISVTPGAANTQDLRVSEVVVR